MNYITISTTILAHLATAGASYSAFNVDTMHLINHKKCLLLLYYQGYAMSQKPWWGLIVCVPTTRPPPIKWNGGIPSKCIQQFIECADTTKQQIPILYKMSIYNLKILQCHHTTWHAICYFKQVTTKTITRISVETYSNWKPRRLNRVSTIPVVFTLVRNTSCSLGT